MKQISFISKTLSIVADQKLIVKFHPNCLSEGETMKITKNSTNMNNTGNMFVDFTFS